MDLNCLHTGYWLCKRASSFAIQSKKAMHSTCLGIAP